MFVNAEKCQENLKDMQKLLSALRLLIETERNAGGMEIEDLKDFAFEKTEEYRVLW